MTLVVNTIFTKLSVTIKSITYTAVIDYNHIIVTPNFIKEEYVANFFLDELENCVLTEDMDDDYSIKYTSHDAGFTMQLKLNRQMTKEEIEIANLKKEITMLKKANADLIALYN